MLQGIMEMSFESAILCFAEGRTIGTLQKDKHHQASEIHKCLQLFQGPFGEKVSCLRGTHWVSISSLFYTDGAYCWQVTNFGIACEALAKLLASQYFTNALCSVLGVNVMFVIGFLIGDDLTSTPF
jgi:hypothetical protein